MKYSRSALGVACVISLATGLSVGLFFAEPAESVDPSQEFGLTVFDRDFLAYDLNWSGGIAITVTDADRDGVIDRWEYVDNGEKVFQVKDRNNDHKLDSWWKRMEDGTGVIATDDNFDGSVDRIERTVTVHKY